MTLAAFADIAEVIGAFGVIAGLIFVGVQLRQNTQQMLRNEANASQAQASAIRLTLLNSRDVAELLRADRAGDTNIDPADEIRLNAFFHEIAFVALNAWDRVRNRIGLPDTFERGVAPVLGPMLASPRGLIWWRRSRKLFPAAFVADLEANFPPLAPPAIEPVAMTASPPANEGAP